MQRSKIYWGCSFDQQGASGRQPATELQLQYSSVTSLSSFGFYSSRLSYSTAVLLLIHFFLWTVLGGPQTPSLQRRTTYDGFKVEILTASVVGSFWIRTPVGTIRSYNLNLGLHLYAMAPLSKLGFHHIHLLLQERQSSVKASQPIARRRFWPVGAYGLHKEDGVNKNWIPVART